MEIDGGKETSPPEHFSLLCKCPTIYGSTLLLAGSPSFSRMRCRGCACSCLPSARGRGPSRTHLGTSGRAADVPPCGLTCFLSGLAHSLLLARPNSFLSTASSALVTQLSSFGQADECEMAFITILISLIASQVQRHVCQPVLAVACLYCWPTYKY